MNEKEIIEYATFLILVIVVVIDTVYLHKLETELTIYKKNNNNKLLNLSEAITNLSIQLYKLNGNLKNLEEKIDILNNTITYYQINISTNFYHFNESLSKLYRKETRQLATTFKLSQLLYNYSSEMTNLLNNIILLRAEIFELKQSLSLISAWFSNTTLSNKTIYNANPLFYNLSKQCFNKTMFNFACLGYSLYESGVKYVRKEDKLEAPTVFLKKGGNCLDYSYFFLSYIDFLKKLGIKYIKLPYNKPGSKCIIYRNKRTYYYIDNCSYKNISLKDYDYDYVSCFLVEKPEIVGHCVVLLCRKPVESMKDIFSKDCLIIEPQDLGFIYDYRINKNNTITLYGNRFKFLVIGLDKLFNKEMICFPYQEQYLIIENYKIANNLACYHFY